MHRTLIKRLDFPEFHRTLLGINDQPIGEFSDLPLAADIATGLHAALPGSGLCHGTIETSDLVSLLGFSLEHEVCHDFTGDVNDMESDDTWQAWFENSSETELLALYEQKYGSPSDPFYVNDWPPLDDPGSAYFHDYVAHEMSASELDLALQQHPEVMLTATVLQDDMRRTLEGLGYQGNEENLDKVQAALELYFGQGNELRSSIYDLLLHQVDRMALLPSPTLSAQTLGG